MSGASSGAATREPGYEHAPSYCRLVFGPKGQTQVWVVVAGDTVYVDRNGNGDLTEPGERFQLSAAESPTQSPRYRAEHGIDGIKVREGRLIHELELTRYRVRPGFTPTSPSDRQLRQLVERDPEATVYAWHAQIEVRELPQGKVAFSGRLRQYAGEDAAGHLQFAPQAKDAPLVHFGGALEMALLNRQELRDGAESDDLFAVIGTPGRGAGTFAAYSYGGLFADDAHPLALLHFPARVSSAPPVQLRVTLDRRC
jgi:hypothetical protein